MAYRQVLSCLRVSTDNWLRKKITILAKDLHWETIEKSRKVLATMDLKQTPSIS